MLIVFISFQVGVFAGRQEALKEPPRYLENTESESIPDFSVFWEAWNNLERRYINSKDLDYKELIYGAINGLVGATDDPYTRFFTSKEAKEFEEELKGHYEGVGMEVAIKDGAITVVSPLENTPAQKAGLKPGDKILKIEDKSTESMSLEKAVSLIRGEEGTAVVLTIGRDSWESAKEITLKRSVIKIPTTKYEIKRGGVNYVKIYHFNAILNKEFRNIVYKIKNSNSKKIILDLRSNPGGYLNTAQDIAGWFLERGKVIVWQDQGEEGRIAYKSAGPSSFSAYEILVLINEGTASGAEILAGTLRDHLGVKLVGKTSFGKGSVQEQIYLDDGSSLKITIARWLTPKGYSINEEGLVPDVEVELTEEDWDAGRDPQLEKGLEIINN